MKGARGSEISPWVRRLKNSGQQKCPSSMQPFPRILKNSKRLLCSSTTSSNPLLPTHFRTRPILTSNYNKWPNPNMSSKMSTSLNCWTCLATASCMVCSNRNLAPFPGVIHRIRLKAIRQRRLGPAEMRLRVCYCGTLSKNNDDGFHCCVDAVN